MIRRILRSRVVYFVTGLCVVAFWLTRWVESFGGPAAVWGDACALPLLLTALRVGESGQGAERLLFGWPA